MMEYDVSRIALLIFWVLLAILLILVYIVIVLLAIADKAFAQEQAAIEFFTQNATDAQTGTVMRNMDGTYYRGDLVLLGWQFVGHIPMDKDDRIWFDQSIDTEFQVLNSTKRGLYVLNSTDSRMPFKVYNSTLTATVGTENRGAVLQESFTFYHQLVPAKPSIDVIANSVLADGQKKSYENRIALNILYHGSIGNDELDNAIYPNRRLIAYDNSTDSVAAVADMNATAIKLFPAGMMPNLENLGIKIPEETSGLWLQEKNVTGLLDVQRVTQAGKPFIYFQNATVAKFYYESEPTLRDSKKMKAIVDDAHSLDVTIPLSWPQHNFAQNVTLGLPLPNKPLSNTFTLTYEPKDALVNATLAPSYFSEDAPKSLTYQGSLRQYAYDRTLHQTNNTELAKMVSLDMPPDANFGGFSAQGTGGKLVIKAHKANLWAPAWFFTTYDEGGKRNSVDNEGDFISKTSFADMVDASGNPMMLTVDFKELGITKTKHYPLYIFDVNYNLHVDAIEKPVQNYTNTEMLDKAVSKNINDSRESEMWSQLEWAGFFLAVVLTPFGFVKILQKMRSTKG